MCFDVCEGESHGYVISDNGRYFKYSDGDPFFWMGINEAYVLILKGRKNTLGFVRNKSDNWMNTLRDTGEVKAVKRTDLDLKADCVTVYPIWEDESANVKTEQGKLQIENLKFGFLFKI